jgi:hypothetical protein
LIPNSAAEMRIKQLEARLEVFNSGGFKDADALAEKFIDLTAKLSEQGELIGRLAHVLNGIILGLPSRRDWLDPDLEKQAHAVVSEATNGTTK